MTLRYAWSICLHDHRATPAFIQNWKRGSEALQRFDGARGAKLYRVNGDLGVFMGVAEWESRQARTEAVKAAEADPDRDWSVPEAFGKVCEHGWLEEVASVDAVGPEQTAHCAVCGVAHPDPLPAPTGHVEAPSVGRPPRHDQPLFRPNRDPIGHIKEGQHGPKLPMAQCWPVTDRPESDGTWPLAPARSPEWCEGCGRYTPEGERRWLLGTPVRLLCPACYQYEKEKAS